MHNSQVYLTSFELARKDSKVHGRKGDGGGVCFNLRTSLNYRISEEQPRVGVNICRNQLSSEYTIPRR